MRVRSLRGRILESPNIWPGFVDILATLLIVIIFILMVFTVSQIYLSDAISGRDKALDNLRNQINELSKILIIESTEKQQVLSELESTQQQLQSEKLEKEELKGDISEKETEILSQDQRIVNLGDQIQLLMNELQIVAKALETYEGDTIASLETANLGERINKALAKRIDQLNVLNKKLEELNIALINKDEDLLEKIKKIENMNIALAVSDENLEQKVLELEQTNEKLNLSQNDLAFKNTELETLNQELLLSQNDLVFKNKELEILNQELLQSEQTKEEQLIRLGALNQQLTDREEALKDSILEYQLLTEELIALNETLDIKDQSLVKQLETIKSRNEVLAQLNIELVEKDKTIFDLRGKIVKLNEVLSIGEEEQIKQQQQIVSLNQRLLTLQSEKDAIDYEAQSRINQSELSATRALEQIGVLSDEIDILSNEIAILNSALDANETAMLAKELKIEVLGERLNKALTSKVFELQKYRSEFFGRLQAILGEREDIKIVGDRFIFESELLFDSGSSTLQSQGEKQLLQIAKTLKQTTDQIPDDINWIIQVEGHTDKRPIQTVQFPSNWELSTARANSVLKFLIKSGFDPNHLSAAGYGEFYPISLGESDKDYRQNRRIELKLTAR